MMFPKTGIRKKRSAIRSKNILISEHDLTVQCENYLDAISACYIRIPDAVYKAIFGSFGIPPQLKWLISSYIKGIPDITILSKDGRFLCVELKVSSNKQTQGQITFAKKVPVTVCRKFDEFKAMVDCFLAEK